MSLPRLLIFASGSATGGGSGFENLVKAAKRGALQAEIVGVVSNREHGGVRERADRLGIPFHHFPKSPTAEDYHRIAWETQADFFALSGWLKLVVGLDPMTRFNSRTVFNIHPGPLPKFGGDGMYGHHVHEAVMEAFVKGEVTHSAVSMHFVTEGYDRGPVFFNLPVDILPDDSAETLARRVNDAEHFYQPLITDMVVSGQIKWDGENPASLVTPDGYRW